MSPLTSPGKAPGSTAATDAAAQWCVIRVDADELVSDRGGESRFPERLPPAVNPETHAPDTEAAEPGEFKLESWIRTCAARSVASYEPRPVILEDLEIANGRQESRDRHEVGNKAAGHRRRCQRRFDLA